MRKLFSGTITNMKTQQRQLHCPMLSSPEKSNIVRMTQTGVLRRWRALTAAALFSGSLSRRMALGFAVVLMVAAVVAITGIVALRTVVTQLDDITQTQNARVALANRLLDDVGELGSQARNVILAKGIATFSDATGADQNEKIMQAAASRYEATAEALQGLLNASSASPDEVALIADILSIGRKVVPLLLDAAKAGDEGDNVAAINTLMVKARKHERNWRTKVEALIALQQAQTDAAAAQARALGVRAIALQWLLIAGAVLAGAWLAWWITRSVTRPLREAVTFAERITAGDLSTDVVVKRRDETGRLLGAMGAMQERLRGMVGHIRQTADSIQVASTEVAMGNQDLSVRTENAASRLQQVSSAMQQLTDAVNQSATSAQLASQLASGAAASASQGGEVMGQVVHTMADIHASSNKISAIITVIDDIAFRTNILALNAAVEAARAGEQGRGFAVVAGEVRNLAGSSAEAAKEIKALIHASVEKVDAGSRLVHDAGRAMGDIVQAVDRVRSVNAEITSAASSQAQQISQIGSSVSDLDQMTQQNAALVEQSAAAAESLREQASRLTHMVGTFRLTA
jgi:methyl-accepting chemotaxis protein